MTVFGLTEIILSTTEKDQSQYPFPLKTPQVDDSSFDAHLRTKLHSKQQTNNDNATAVSIDRSYEEGTFTTVRSLFSCAATALDLELKERDAIVWPSASEDDEGDDEIDTATHCHWVPGRIEVMGKHTDYAGGNSLVCATSGRGMAMVSTYMRNDDEQTNNYDGIDITIVSVLQAGMEHHATAATVAPYQVDGRPVVHHTIHIMHNNKSSSQRMKGNDDKEKEVSVDWTIYPTAVIHRLHQNFDLLHSSGGGGGHIYIAMSSNLPPASGLSTSSAFVTGLYLVLNSHLHLTSSTAYKEAIGKADDDDSVYNLSTYLGNVENGRDYINGSSILKGTVQVGVGTFGGSEDHAAILMGKRGEMCLLSFCPTRPASIDVERVVNEVISPVVGHHVSLESPEPLNLDSVIQLPSDLTFVIAYSGAKAEKAGGVDGATDASIGYNSASDLAKKAFDAYIAGGVIVGLESSQTLADAIRWKRKRLGSNNQSSNQSIKACMMKRIKAGALAMKEGNSIDKENYAKALLQRFTQFYNESECLVPSAAHAFTNEQYNLLGPIVDASHRGAVTSLKNQIAETAWLPLWARGMESTLQMEPLSIVKANMQNATKPQQAVGQHRRVKALAASAFGAGFGGSCWALVYRAEAQYFAQQWKIAYESQFPPNHECKREFFVTDPGPGAFCV